MSILTRKGTKLMAWKVSPKDILRVKLAAKGAIRKEKLPLYLGGEYL